MKDGTYWAEKLRTKEISFPELLADIQKRIDSKNPSLNSIITVEDAAALADYQQRAQINESPFCGLPIPLKMLGQEKKGWLSTSGSRLLKDHRSSYTSNFVKKAEQAGLVPFAQTNAPEFGFKNVTDPQLYGETSNPWNTAHTPGGSSGGAAAAVASGIVPIAGASDGGGSIRIPASFCGLVGLKPSRGAMPDGPDYWRGWQGAAVHFFLTTSMRDTETLFYAMRGMDPAGPYQVSRNEWMHTQAAAKEKLKIALVMESPVGTPISPEAEKAVKEAAIFLESLGHEVEELSYPLNGEQLIQSYYDMNGAETAAMFHGIEQGIGRKVVKEDMEPMTWAIYRYGLDIKASDYIQTLELWDYAANKMERIFDTYDLFLSPATAETAPKLATDLQSPLIREQLAHSEDYSHAELSDLIQQMFAKSLAITPHTQLANLTGLPAISLPTAVSENGLPLGIQFMAGKGREDLLLQIGKIFEEHQKFELPEYYRS